MEGSIHQVYYSVCFLQTEARCSYFKPCTDLCVISSPVHRIKQTARGSEGQEIIFICGCLMQRGLKGVFSFCLPSTRTLYFPLTVLSSPPDCLYNQVCYFEHRFSSRICTLFSIFLLPVNALVHAIITRAVSLSSQLLLSFKRCKEVSVNIIGREMIV